jgi:foldase protein PrsA
MRKLEQGSDFADLAQEISLDNETARKGGLFPGWVRRGEDDLGIGNAAAVSEALFSAEKGDIAGPVEAGGYYYIFRIENKRQAQPRPFEECAEQVKNDYYMQKLTRAYEKLLDQAVQAAGVKLFPEALEAENSK